MIVQTNMTGTDEVIYWDQANQVKQYRMSKEKLERDYPRRSRSEAFYGYNIIDNTNDDSEDNYVRVVHWNDRMTEQPHILFSHEKTFILNDDGKTFVIV